MKNYLWLLFVLGVLSSACHRIDIERERSRYPDYEPHGRYHEEEAVIIYHGDAPPFVPPGHLPPPGHARLWYFDRPPGQQPPPFRY